MSHTDTHRCELMARLAASTLAPCTSCKDTRKKKKKEVGEVRRNSSTELVLKKKEKKEKERSIFA